MNRLARGYSLFDSLCRILYSVSDTKEGFLTVLIFVWEFRIKGKLKALSRHLSY